MTHLALFAKDPAHAACKTRLARAIGSAAATAYYAASLRRILAGFADPRPGDRPAVYLTPADGIGDFGKRFGWPHPVYPQPEGDLGARLAAAFARAAGPCVVLGTDMPELNPAHVDAARAPVAAGEVAMGPCPDGGYYLLGADRLHPTLFDAMPWSTPRLQAETAARAAAAGLTLRRLGSVDDIDEIGDLEALAGRLDPGDPLAAIVATALAARVGPGPGPTA